MERIELETPRLLLRAWRDSDLDSLAELCADPLVMRYFPELLSRDDCAAAMARCRLHFARFGFGFWALELKSDERFVGLAGLSWSRLQLPFCPVVEIGWRLGHEFWGQGFAREAAEASLACGFDRLQLPEVVAYTAALNDRSQALMETLGMQRQPAGDFDHPNIAEGHPVRPQVLYRMTEKNWADIRR
ncbi:GNAT family N-acetyltransferase [Pseudomonas xanthomarina]|nr:GNAT family N-acetyltransferase [Stutzerimonas xanthomarina]MCP9337090.1 GNAT family N-acetyltransferase [Stutzerimonas xanthomarina]